MPALARVLETALHVEDLDRAAEFYGGVLELALLEGEGDARFRAYDVGGESVLLLFLKGGTSETVVLPGGTIPPHDGAGRLHLAFAVAAAELGSWEERLAQHGVAIEARVQWPRGGQSIYFRDPDQHLVEFATPGIWRTY